MEIHTRFPLSIAEHWAVLSLRSDSFPGLTIQPVSRGLGKHILKNSPIGSEVSKPHGLDTLKKHKENHNLK